MFEFKRVFHAEGRNYSQGTIEERLNDLGSQGWQVINCQVLDFEQVKTGENHGHGSRLEIKYHILLQRSIDSGL